MVLNPVQSGGTNLSFLGADSNEEEEGTNPVTRSTSNSSPTREGHRNAAMQQQQLPQRSPFGIQQLLGLSGNGSPIINRSNPDRFKNGGHNDLPSPATFTMSHHHQLFPGSMMSHPSLTNSSLSGNHCLTNHSIASGQSSPHQHQGQSSLQVSNLPSSSSSSSSSSPSSSSFSAPTSSFSAPTSSSSFSAPTSSSFSQAAAAAAAADSAARLAYLTSSPAAAALMSASMASMSAAAHHHHQIHHPGGHHPGSMSMFHPAFTSSPSGSVVDPMTGVPHGKILIDTFLGTTLDTFLGTTFHTIFDTAL